MGRLLLRQFTSPIMLVLIGATVVSMLVDDALDGSIILTIVLISGMLGFLQEHRADQTMKRLAAMVRVHADVRRNGEVVEVPVSDVVVGDVVVLKAGDLIPGDLRITDSSALLIDEASLTGESVPVEKGLQASSGMLPADMAFFGSHVVSGQGEGVVQSVGTATRFGALVARLESQDVVTSFEREMTKFGYLLTRVMLVLVAAVLVVQAIADRSLIQSVMFALALAVGLTPQMLPAIVMVSLSAGARRMAAEQVLIRRLDVIEDIGAMSLLCADKTGTLTEGSLALQQAMTLDGQVSDRVLDLAARNASMQSSYVNAMDAAITAAHKVEGKASAEIPYDFSRRRMSVLTSLEGEQVLVTKGAVDSILDVCATMNQGDRSVPVDAEQVHQFIKALSSKGSRVIAVATKPISSSSVGVSDESQMHFEGVVTFLDPPRTGVADAVARLAELNVAVAVISGDNRHVTRAVAESVGIPAERLLTGGEIEALDDSALFEGIDGVRVFAEIEPLQKERIVRAFQKRGEGVGFLGDGINDSAALRRADVGISVESASDVAKQSAAMVIMNKDLNVIADALLMGRRTIANTLKYIRVTISANFGNVISMVVASLFLPFLPMLPVQILLLNLLSDAPALAIAGDSVEDEELERPHVWSLDEIWRFMIAFGLISSIFDITAFAVLRGWLGVDAPVFHTAWFLLSLCTEVIALIVLRTRRPLQTSHPSRLLLGVSGVVIAVAGMMVAFGWIERLGLVPLAIGEWWLIVVLALGYLVTNEVAKRRVGSRLVS